MLRWMLLLASISYSAVDLKAPFDVRKINSSALFDTIEVATYLINDGNSTALSVLYPDPYIVVSIGVDSFNIKGHSVSTINPKSYWSFLDTIVVVRGPFSIFTLCDPLLKWGEAASEAVNNVRSQAFNFHPTTQLVTDTVVVYDTVRVTVHDTVQVGPPTLAKAASLARQAPIASMVYNAAGAKVWEGMLPLGGYPPAGLRPGLHLIVQGNRGSRFRVAYR